MSENCIAWVPFSSLAANRTPANSHRQFSLKLIYTFPISVIRMVGPSFPVLAPLLRPLYDIRPRYLTFWFYFVGWLDHFPPNCACGIGPATAQNSAKISIKWFYTLIWIIYSFMFGNVIFFSNEPFPFWVPWTIIAWRTVLSASAHHYGPLRNRFPLQRLLLCHC